MWYLEKKVIISSAHYLRDYKGKCANLHGHNWLVIVRLKSSKLDRIGMVLDFKRIKEEVDKLDHGNLNELIKPNPTAENLAKYIADSIPYCYEVEIHEQEGSVCRYVKD